MIIQLQFSTEMIINTLFPSKDLSFGMIPLTKRKTSGPENSIKTNWNWKQNWRYLIKHCDIKIKGYRFNLPSKQNQNFCPDERENVKKLSASPTFLTLNPLIFHLFLCCSSNIDIFIFVYYVIFETTIIYKFYDNIYYLLIHNTIY